MWQVWTVAGLTLASAASQAAERSSADILVYLHSCNEKPKVVMLAQGQTRRMLASAGIACEWRAGNPRSSTGALVIDASFARADAAGASPDALASSALAPGQARIVVFAGRVWQSGPADALPAILAHVFAHEITHVLEGVSRHAESGLMKAHWDQEDFKRMRQGPLPFEAEDLNLLHAWAALHRGIALQPGEPAHGVAAPCNHP